MSATLTVRDQTTTGETSQEFSFEVSTTEITVEGADPGPCAP